jgi:hypothetical protein
MNIEENNNLTSIYLKMVNEDINQNKKIKGLQSIVDKENTTDNLVKMFEKGYHEQDEDLINYAIVKLLRMIGLNDTDILSINIYEIFLNEMEGRALENSIQGFNDPNDIYTPGEILRAKLEQIRDDMSAGNLRSRYYFYRDSPDEDMALKPHLVPH